jgi:hypothetical protein
MFSIDFKRTGTWRFPNVQVHESVSFVTVEPSSLNAERQTAATSGADKSDDKLKLKCKANKTKSALECAKKWEEGDA